MKMAMLMLAIFIAGLLKPSVGSAIRQLTPLSKTVLDFEPLHITELHERVDDTQRSLYMKFTAFNQEFDLTLFHQPSFSQDAVVININDGGFQNSQAPRISKSYRTHDNTVALTLDGDIDHLVRGVIEQSNDIFHVMTLDDVSESMDVADEARTIMKSADTRLLIFRDADIIGDPDYPQLYGIANDNSTESGTSEDLEPQFQLLDPNFLSAVSRERRASSVFPPPYPCPKEPRDLKMGFAADDRFLKRLRSANQSFQSWLDTNINIISKLYLKTFHTTITVKSIIVPTSGDKLSWNSKYCPSIYTKLYQFSEWRGTSDVGKGLDEGLFHLMSGCYSRGTIGLAWKGVLCRKRARIQNGNEWVSGTGVSSGRGLGWTTAAHEIGHQFGADHDKSRSPTGIMYPSTTSSEVFTRATQNSVCRALKYKLYCFDKEKKCIPKCESACGLLGCCGDDGCGGSCGSCSPRGSCSAGICTCTPNCTGRQCGSDGCGGTCGECGSDQSCTETQCVNDSLPSQSYLLLHNSAREDYGLAPLVWSDDLALRAKHWVQQCNVSLENEDGVGFNIYSSLRHPSDSFKGVDMIKKGMGDWLNQRKMWSCFDDSCKRGGHCRDFTQIIHEDGKSVGCSHVYCPAIGKYNTMCYYDVDGRYASSKPFDSSQCESPSSNALLKKCQPNDSCEKAGKECGTHFNGCEFEECGECAKDSKCENHICVCDIVTSCEAEAKTCGTIEVGCGITENCGSCEGNTPCIENRCSVGCTPLTTCEQQGRTCGTISNGCGEISCGDCLGDQSCDNGVCSVCSSCHAMAICKDTECVCRPGFFKSGEVCNPLKDIISDKELDNEGKLREVIHNSWKVSTGNEASWKFRYNYLEHSTSVDTIDVALLNENLPCSENTITSWTLSLTKTKSSHHTGIAFSIDKNTQLLFWYDSTDKTFKFSIAEHGNSRKIQILAKNLHWSDHTTKIIRAEIIGTTNVIIFFESEQYSYAFTNDVSFDLCSFGAYSKGYAKFSNVAVTSKSQLLINLSRNMPVDEFQEKISKVLKISTDHIMDVQTPSSPLNRRDAVGGSTAFLFSLSGSSSMSSTALASTLSAAVAQQSSTLAVAGLVATTISEVAPALGAGFRDVSIRSTTTGLSSAAIVGVVGGGVAVVGVAIAGGIYIKKRGQNSSSSTSSSIGETTESNFTMKEKPSFGVNIMNPDAHLSRTFSLTQRNYIGYDTPQPSAE